MPTQYRVSVRVERYDPHQGYEEVLDTCETVLDQSGVVHELRSLADGIDSGELLLSAEA